jgi:hypothetical protein
MQISDNHPIKKLISPYQLSEPKEEELRRISKEDRDFIAIKGILVGNFRDIE